MNAAPGGQATFPAPFLTVSRGFGGNREVGRRLLLYDPFLQRLTGCCTMAPVCAEDLVTLEATAVVDGVLALHRDPPPLPGGTCAVEDYEGLHDSRRRNAFLALLFALAGLRDVSASGSRGRLVDFHARYKYLIMTCGPQHVTGLGHVVAGVARVSWERAVASYRAGLVRAFAAPASPPATANALSHVFGYVSARLDAAERAHFLERLEAVRTGEEPAAGVIALLHGWVLRHDEPYLREQALFRPYPDVLTG